MAGDCMFSIIDILEMRLWSIGIDGSVRIRNIHVHGSGGVVLICFEKLKIIAVT